MNGGNRKARIIGCMALLFLVAFFGCQNYEDVIVREKEPTADDAERAERLLNSAREYLNSELYTQAESACREVLDIESGNKGAYTLLGTALWRQEKHDEVFQLYREFTEKFPDDPDGYARLAAVYGDRGDYAAAAQKMQKAVALDPDDVTLHGDLGHYYVQLEMWDEAQGHTRTPSSVIPRTRTTRRCSPRCIRSLARPMSSSPRKKRSWKRTRITRSSC
jgi:tetratricopeptide (TPR) repeat protein